MAQPLITTYFNKRKRLAEHLTVKSKVLVLDRESTKATVEETSTKTIGKETECSIRNIIYQLPTRKAAIENASSKRSVGVYGKTTTKVLAKKSSAVKRIFSPEISNQTDIREVFKPRCFNDKPEEIANLANTNEIISTNQDQQLSNTQETTSNVPFKLLGTLSPSKEMKIKDKKDEAVKDDFKSGRKELGLTTPKKLCPGKNMTFNDIRTKVINSSRRNELEALIGRFNKKNDQLKEIEAEKQKIVPSSPQLQRFKSINLEVPLSPQKTFSVSPAKRTPQKTYAVSPANRTPLKSPIASPIKSPAYQRHAYLTQSGALALPYTYQCLAETFRCTDTVSSMFYNRKENITFQKMKAAVQEMSRRNFTEQHLGQIKKVYPEAYTFHQEKCKHFSVPTRDKYTLVITPNFNRKSNADDSSSHQLMTPSVLLERRELFQRRLLDLVKNYHEEFLQTLDSPMVIPRETLMRWHPEFDLEQIPIVVPDELPVPPHEEKCSTAKDVLERARHFLNYNPKMEKALEDISKQENNSKPPVTPTKNKSDDSSTSSLLKGIPKALLEKVRARQAAKALIAMTRTPAQDKEALQYSRLPELARILRNVFVGEKKNILPISTVLTKLSNSYRESLSCSDLEHHLRLLIKVVPEWLEVHYVRKADYVKIAKSLDLSVIVKKLEEMAENKK